MSLCMHASVARREPGTNETNVPSLGKTLKASNYLSLTKSCLMMRNVVGAEGS
jgi:hypothetical protein